SLERREVMQVFGLDLIGAKVLELLQISGQLPRIRGLEDLQHFGRGRVMPVRIVEGKKDEEWPVSKAVHEIHGVIRDVLGQAVLAEVHGVETGLEAVGRGYV